MRFRVGLMAIPTLAFAAFLALATPGAAQQPFTLEQILSSPFPSEMTAAPMGSRIAWIFNSQGRRNIWGADGPKFEARQITRYTDDDGQDLGSLSFSYDGEWLAYVRGGNKNQAGEVPNPQSNPAGVEQAVWVVGWKGFAPRRIDAGNSPAVSPRGDWVAYLKDGNVWLARLASAAGEPQQISVRGRSSSLAWSPDGGKLAFVSNRGTHSFIAVYDLQRKAVEFIDPGVDRDSAPLWSPDSRSLAFIRIAARESGAPDPGPLTAPDQANPWTIRVADVARGTSRQVWASGARQQDSIPRMAGDALLNWAGDGLLVFASEMDGWLHLYSLPVAGGDPRLLTPGDCEFEQMTFTPDRRQIVYSSNCEDIDRRHLWRVAVAGGAPEMLTGGTGIEWAPAVTGDARTIAYFASDARQPAMPFVRATDARGSGQMLAAEALPRDFPSSKLVVPQQVILEAADGVKFHNQLFLPAGIKPGERRPAVIFMHGGPVRQMFVGWHNRGYYHRAYAFNQYLASRGYIVLSVNYRSGIGYGRAFREAANRGARGASEYQDIVAAGKYLYNRADVDPVRIGLWGGSYGGYLTAMGLARNSDLFAAGVDLHGVHDWSARQFGGGLASDRARLARESSPVADIDKWRSPVLLIHGDDDRNVDFAQTIDLVARLRRQNVKFELMTFPDEVHDFLLYSNWLKIYAASADFFDRYLKGGGQRAGGAQE
jgi:dipeptidyl aminopeptidase/acylaminoacyl peptidase